LSVGDAPFATFLGSVLHVPRLTERKKPLSAGNHEAVDGQAALVSCRWGLEVFTGDRRAGSRTWTAQTDGSLALTRVSQSVYASAKDKLCTESDKC
jgi:hypothetical protein